MPLAPLYAAMCYSAASELAPAQLLSCLPSRHRRVTERIVTNSSAELR